MALGLGLGLTRGRAAGAFSPSSLFAANEQGVWYDPSDLTTLFQDTAGTTPVTAAGQSVARINDKSGRGNNATQATAGNRPTYQVDGNGRGYLSFDGADDFLLTGTITPGVDKMQVFAGARKQSDAASAVIVEASISASSNNGAMRLAAPFGAAANYAYHSRGTVDAIPTSASSFASPNLSILTGLGDISGDSAILRINGSVAAQVTTDQGTGNYLAYPLYIGRRGGTSLAFNGRLYGLAVRYGANLSSTQINQMEAWMNGKTGAF